MKIWTLDFETYFDGDYTLKKLTTEAYIRDPRFEALMLAVRYPDGAQGWIAQEHIPSFLAGIDWSTDAILCHHAHFDGLIFSHHYGVRPRMWFDTLSMARLVLGNHLSAALGSLSKHYGLEEKSVPYEAFKGRRWREIDASLREQLGAGAMHDCALTYDIFTRLAQEFPVEEYGVVDTTVRMFTEPVLIGDVAMLDQVQAAERERKYTLLNRLGVTDKDLASADRFCALLEQCGIEIQYKDGKNGPIPAVAATDDFMIALENDYDETVSALAAARLEVKSTLNETRAGRLAGMARRGPMPVYLSYCGAHTTRWSGGDRVNLQNLPRGGDLRRAVCAPDGYVLAPVDASQIECRILNWFAGQWDVIEKFRDERDIYSENASRFYGRTITKADKLERGFGKVQELASGYGLGAVRFQRICALGPMGAPPIVLDDAEAKRAIDQYRNTHQEVVKLWKEAESILGSLHRREQLTWRGILEVRDGRIYGPGGTWLNYRTLEGDEDGWKLKTRKGYVRTYGAKLVENVIQWLARIVMSQAMMRVVGMGYKVATTTHDELLVLIRESATTAQEYKAVEAELARDVDWMPGLPLKAEGGYDKRYTK